MAKNKELRKNRTIWNIKQNIMLLDVNHNANELKQQEITIKLIMLYREEDQRYDRRKITSSFWYNHNRHVLSRVAVRLKLIIKKSKATPALVNNVK